MSYQSIRCREINPSVEVQLVYSAVPAGTSNVTISWVGVLISVTVSFCIQLCFQCGSTSLEEYFSDGLLISSVIDIIGLIIS